MHRQTPRASRWKSSAQPVQASYYAPATTSVFWQRLTAVYSWALLGATTVFAALYTML